MNWLESVTMRVRVGNKWYFESHNSFYKGVPTHCKASNISESLRSPHMLKALSRVDWLAKNRWVRCQSSYQELTVSCELSEQMDWTQPDAY